MHQNPDSDWSGLVSTVLGRLHCKRQTLIVRRENEMKTQIPSRPFKSAYQRERVGGGGKSWSDPL